MSDAATPANAAPEVEEDIAGVARWPATLAVLLIGTIFFFISSKYTVGPSWVVLAVTAALLIPLWATRRRGMHHWTRAIALALNGVLTLAVASSAILLLVRLSTGETQSLALLRDASLIWGVNIVVFALWYWNLDAGGPAKRHPGKHASSDFAFPQQQQDDDGEVEGVVSRVYRLPVPCVQHLDRLLTDRYPGARAADEGADDAPIGDFTTDRGRSGGSRDQYDRWPTKPVIVRGSSLQARYEKGGAIN